MGCDIHSVGQIKKDGKWETLNRRFADNRNYDSFAVMADVRNGHGFAGCLTGEGWDVLFPVRGFPNDVEIIDGENIKSPEAWYFSWDTDKEEPETVYWLGDHSHSWLTLQELHIIKEYYEDKKYITIGYISKDQKEKLNKGTLPNEWCGYTNMQGYVQASWERPALDNLYTLKNYVEELDKIAKEHSLDISDVRLVFGFDS